MSDASLATNKISQTLNTMRNNLALERKNKRKTRENGDKKKIKLNESKCSCSNEIRSTSKGKGVISYPQSTTKEQSKMGRGEVVFLDHPEELTKILDDKIQLAVWRQKSVPNFITALSNSSISSEDLPTFEGMVLAKEGYVSDFLKKRFWVPYGLRSHKARKKALDEDAIDQLVNQIDKLVQVFARVAKDSGYLGDDEENLPILYMKLKVVDDNGCQYWHQDCVPFRLVSTFLGPSTEWIPPEFSKETLQNHTMNSKHSQSLSNCDVALFKGRGETEEEDEFLNQPGIVHRSPRTEESGIYRLVLVIDIPMEGYNY